MRIYICSAKRKFVSTLHDIPHFSKSGASENEFLNLRKQIYQSIGTLPASRKYYPVIKAVLLPVIYFGLYFFALKQTQYPFFLLIYITLGFLVVTMFVNLIHEACHHNLFESNRKANEWYMLLFDLLGANSYIWRKRHVRLHHNYPNVVGWDSDIEKSDYLRVHPEDKTRNGGKHQQWMILLYPLFVLNWFLIRDFRDFFTTKTIVGKLGRIPKKEYVKLIFFKLFFLGYMVGMPALLTPFSLGNVMLAWLIFMIITGSFGLIVLLPPHANIFNEFPVADENGNLKHSWLYHQLSTTNDVTMDNWFSRHLMANFNYHIIHHLFPNISYVYAREATDALKKYCILHQLPYRSLPLFTAILGHFKLIVSYKSSFNIWEEDM